MSESRALIAAVIAPGWQMPNLDTIAAPQVAQAIAEIELAPSLLALEPVGIVPDDKQQLGIRFVGEKSKLLADHLRPIGAKIQPTMTPHQIGVWMAAMVLALGDLPARVAIGAARKAIHTPMQFLNEVEKAIRDCAEEIRTTQRVALHRLRAMQREIERAKNAQPRLEAPKSEPWTQERVDEANALFVSQGLRMRYRLDPSDPEGISSYQAGPENSARDIDAPEDQA